MYSAKNIADWFLTAVDRDSGDSITHLKLQKLIYFAQAWSLALRDKPLFNEDFQAWAHGPVVRSVFDKWKIYSWDALPLPANEIVIKEEDAEFLNDIYQTYGDLSAKNLEDITHQESPWINARGDLSPEQRSEAIITKESMSNFYKKLFKEVNGEEQ